MGVSATTIWMPILVLHAIAVPPILVLFGLRRNRNPIQLLRPKLMLFIQTFNFIITIYTCALPLGINVSFAFRTITYNAAMAFLIDGYVMMAVSLYIAFNHIAAGYDFLEQLANSNADLAAFSRRVRRLRFLMSDQGATFVICVSQMVQLTIQFILLSRYPALFSREAGEALADPTSGARTLFNFANYKNVLSCLACVYLSFKLRIVADGTGIKATLKRAGIVLISSIIIRFITQPIFDASGDRLYLSVLFYIAGFDLSMYFCLIQPLVYTFRTAIHPVEDDVPEGINSDLKMYLATPDGYKLFKNFLEKEFSVENLLFYHDAQHFEGEFASRAMSANVKAARHLHEAYLGPDSPFQVNIDSSMTMTFHELFANNVAEVRADMFASAASVVLDLVATNSFFRFRTSNPDAWAKFKADTTEKRHWSLTSDLHKKRDARSASNSAINRDSITTKPLLPDAHVVSIIP